MKDYANIQNMDNSIRAGAGRHPRKALAASLLTFAVAAGVVAGASVGPAWAYFSASARTSGGHTLQLGHEEHVDETFSSWTKHVQITSTEDSRPVYVRARGFSDYALDYSAAESWQASGDWVYYRKILNPGETTEDLAVQILQVPTSAQLPTLADGDSFNVIIVYETAPVEYDEKGDPVGPQNVDWTGQVDTYRTGTAAGAAGRTMAGMARAGDARRTLAEAGSGQAGGESAAGGGPALAEACSGQAGGESAAGGGPALAEAGFGQAGGEVL